MPDENNHIDQENDRSKIALLIERQRVMWKRLLALEGKHAAVETMINRYIGGIALLVAVGVIIGWLFTIKSGLPFFSR